MDQTCYRCHGTSSHYQQANLKRCSGCRSVYYCSTACQEYDWVEHIFDCNPSRSINTADHLVVAVRKHLIPSDPQTRRDYGFDRAGEGDEEANLLGLYTGLIDKLEVPPKKIHSWRIRRVLVDKIKAEFYKLPEGARGEHFSWFLKNEHVIALAGRPRFADTEGDALVCTWRFIGGSERESPEEIKVVIQSKPEDEQLDLWVHFGFAACRSEIEEMQLSARYYELVNKCGFPQFLHARRTYRLLDLFRLKGLQVGDHRYLRDPLGGSWTKSVWWLKQAIRQKDSRQAPHMHPAVMCDYGFGNCVDDSEWRELKKVYRDFFDKHSGDPLMLHEIAIKGNIHRYLSTVMQDLGDPKFRVLMKNPYPLPEYD